MSQSSPDALNEVGGVGVGGGAVADGGAGERVGGG